jgi:hypothetical protein
VAESDPVKRLRAAAQRAAGSVAVETQHRWYMNELEETIGRDPSGSGGWHPETPARAAWLGPVLLVVLISAMTFAATVAILLWRDGTLGRYFESRPLLQKPKTPKWVLGDMETGRPSPVPTGKAPQSDAPPNEIEPLIHPAAQTEVTESEPTSNPAE